MINLHTTLHMIQGTDWMCYHNLWITSILTVCEVLERKQIRAVLKSRCAGTEIYWKFNAMAVDALHPLVANSSAIVLLNLYELFSLHAYRIYAET